MTTINSYRLSIHGWDAEVIQPEEDGANFDRFPESFPPRNVANIKQVCLIRAVKK